MWGIRLYCGSGYDSLENRSGLLTEGCLGVVDHDLTHGWMCLVPNSSIDY